MKVFNSFSYNSNNFDSSFNNNYDEQDYGFSYTGKKEQMKRKKPRKSQWK